MGKLAPIVLFAYNRPAHTALILDALSENFLANESLLYIYLDGLNSDSSQKQREEHELVRKVICQRKWCGEVEIIEREKNYGLSNSIISGVREVLNKHGKIIVLENDILTSRGFLKYMNEALELYEFNEKVMYVSGYMYPVKTKLPETFFCNATCTWGWATWSRAWEHLSTDSVSLLEQLNSSGRIKEFTMNDKNYLLSLLARNVSIEENNKTISADIIHSYKDWCWDICWYTSLFLRNGLSLYPNKSLVRNIGHDATGTHCKESWWSEIYNNQEITDNVSVESVRLEMNAQANKTIEEFHELLLNATFMIKAREKLKLMFRKSKS
jgi:hypothetical protein